MPDDLPLRVTMSALDVYPAASHTRALARPGQHVLILGAGHAGLLAALRSLGEPRADLTLACTSVPGCEGTAILATRDGGSPRSAPSSS